MTDGEDSDCLEIRNAGPGIAAAACWPDFKAGGRTTWPSSSILHASWFPFLDSRLLRSSQSLLSMRSIFRSNKSNSSIERFSRESSPTQPEAPANAYPPPAQTAPPAQRFPGGSGQSQYDGASDSPEQRRYHEPDQVQTHPAHQLTRSGSHRAGVGPDAAHKTPGRPSVHIIGPSSPAAEPPVYEEQRFPPPPPSQLQPVAPDKERRKSKKSFFGLHSSLKESKGSTSPVATRAPGRTGSLLRKPQSGQQGHSVTISGPYSQAPPGNPEYQERNQEAFYNSQDSLTDSEDRTPNERLYRQGQDPFDRPQSQSDVQPADQLRGDPRYSQQYQGDRERPSEESVETYLAYQQHQQEQQAAEEEGVTAFDSRQIRPPSQLSLLGPPSPGTQSLDSRPSSATNLSSQSRFSTQSAAAVPPLSQQQQQHIVMARGDPPSNGLRDQMSQQRDPRLQEPGHGQYAGQQDPRSRVSQHAEQGRSTPPPRSREDISNMDFQTLLQRHEELQSKYSKVKRYYFEKDTQVTQLQNLIANQRLSMSKTMFDDHQYTSRFDRLNGAIRDLAFSIRKDWKGIPPWLTHVVNRDAHTVGTKEMTAVGRACITCWLMDEIFNRFFHPDLEPGLSSQLKLIEKTLRRTGNSTQVISDEQREDLTTKLITWRLATVEGLADHLASPQAAEYRLKLVNLLTERLTAALKVNLPEATPAGLDTGVGMIIELAVSIAQCLPMESRDICIEYFMPGAPINDTYMKTEAPPAPLSNPGATSVPPAPTDDSDEGVEGSPEDNQSKLENEIREAAGKAATTGTGRTEGQSAASGKTKKGSFLGGLVTKKPPPPGTNSAGAGFSAKDVAEHAGENNDGKIRMAVFFVVEVRGKAGTGKEGGGSGGDKPIVLIRAPVFGY